MKRILSLFLIIVLTLSLAPSMHANAAVKINKAKVTVKIGATVTLKISGTKSKVTWKTDKNTVATVSSKGIVTAKGVGKANITAKVGKKTYKCIVTVKDFSKWILFGTDDYDYVRDGILTGEIFYYDEDYYLVSPEYYKKVIEPKLEAISDARAAFVNDISTNNAIDQHMLDPDAEFIWEDDTDTSKVKEDAALQEKISAMSRYGFGSSEDLETSIGKAYIEFCNSWVSEFELENTYKISAAWNWPKNQIYLTQDFENKLIIENAPVKFVSGEIYSGSGVQYQYLEKFEYEGESYVEKQYYFNREDLKTAGIIK